ncbi:uncharacterized protein [Ciconia boyciana]|uniref:uncharacterized protein isoform X1 n=1 Tax=Ciconia boyciana TaxID=52775 RepID=UPI003BA15383
MPFSPGRSDVTSFPNCSTPHPRLLRGEPPRPTSPLHRGVPPGGGREARGMGRPPWGARSRGGGRRSGAEAEACPTSTSLERALLLPLFFLGGGARGWKASPREGRGLQGAVAGQPLPLRLSKYSTAPALPARAGKNSSRENTRLALEEPGSQGQAAVALLTRPQHGRGRWHLAAVPSRDSSCPASPPGQGCIARSGGPRGPAVRWPASRPPAPARAALSQRGTRHAAGKGNRPPWASPAAVPVRATSPHHPQGAGSIVCLAPGEAARRKIPRYWSALGNFGKIQALESKNQGHGQNQELGGCAAENPLSPLWRGVGFVSRGDERVSSIFGPCRVPTDGGCGPVGPWPAPEQRDGDPGREKPLTSGRVQSRCCLHTIYRDQEVTPRTSCRWQRARTEQAFKEFLLRHPFPSVPRQNVRLGCTRKL